MGPPPLHRTSAMVRVRFTPEGRRLARKLCLEDRDTYMYYSLEREGRCRHMLVDSSGRVREFADAALVPERVCVL